MLIRQEETTPIGDYFHDCGIFQVFNKLAEEVDEIDVETTELNVFCDSLIQSLKGLKSKSRALRMML